MKTPDEIKNKYSAEFPALAEAEIDGPTFKQSSAIYEFKVPVAEKPLKVSEECAIYDVKGRLDPVTEKIVLLLKDMPDEDRRAILKNVEEKKLLHELMEERGKLKDAG